MDKLSSFFLDTLEVVVFAVAIFLFVYLIVLQPHKIKGASMLPNFQDGEYILSDKLSYRFGEPKRGDVIIFEAPGANGDEFIKRIIGLPGEKVAIKENKLYINGNELKESYLPSTFDTLPGAFLQENEEKVIPENSYFVLGDNRRHSSDSRSWGFIEKDVITGRAWIIYWPTDELGKIEDVSYSL
ncbi:signal peptidase I [Candidatus Woesebacteria bacterium]|nr:MAG: signal peptidase I [Candidatus Woesebacteria bacterium]